MKRFKKRRRIPPFFWICLLLFAISALLYGIAMLSPTFADQIDAVVGQNLRRLLAALTSPIPFSLGEVLLVLVPVVLIFILVLLFRRKGNASFVFFRSFGIVLLIFSMFLSVLGVSYRKTTLDARMHIERAPVRADELAVTARLLLDLASAELDSVTFDASGSSVMPYDLDTLSSHLVDAYARFATETGLVESFPSTVKGVALSVPMSYAHLLGIYLFFTGEANINMDYPDVDRPSTAAHELAHQRGIAREDEASFVAFLVSLYSLDPYVRYSGALTLYRYVASALYCADPERYFALFDGMDARIRGELSALSAYQKKYSGNKLGEISSTLNDAYLKANGTEGEVSYGLVVDLAVAYLKENPQSAD